jgi:hypothetical protein
MQRPPPEEEAIPLEPAVAAARSAMVKHNIEVIKMLKADGFTAEGIKKEVLPFANEFPGLFKMLLKIDIGNEGLLKTVLAMLDKMGSSKMTQDQASGVVGQRLYDTYIKPKIGEDRPPAP